MPAGRALILPRLVTGDVLVRLIAAKLGMTRRVRHRYARADARRADPVLDRGKVLRTPVPLTGAATLRAETPTDRTGWTAAFLTASASEAEDWLQLFMDLELGWVTGFERQVLRRNECCAGQRNSRSIAPAALTGLQLAIPKSHPCHQARWA